MPLIGFKPLKARLVIEEGRESILVMKVAVAEGETVILTPGGRLEALPGVLRIRERRETPGNMRPKTLGTLVYVPGTSSSGESGGAAKFQIDVTMAGRKFDALLRVALTGALPTKFFVEAGEKVVATRPTGLRFGAGAAGRIKIWDTAGHRKLPVTDFSIILPIAVPPASSTAGNGGPPVLDSVAGNVQLVEFADEILSSQAESRAMLVGVLAIIAVIVLLILLADLTLVFK